MKSHRIHLQSTAANIGYRSKFIRKTPLAEYFGYKISFNRDNMNARPKFQVFQGTLWYFCSKKLDVKKFKPCVFITIRSHYYCKYVLIKNNTLSELNIVLRSQLTIMLATPLHLNRASGPRTAITPIDPSSVYDYDLRASSLAGETSRLSATRCYADAPAFKWRSQRCVIISPSREPIIAHVLLFFFASD